MRFENPTRSGRIGTLGSPIEDIMGLRCLDAADASLESRNE